VLLAVGAASLAVSLLDSTVDVLRPGLQAGAESRYWATAVWLLVLQATIIVLVLMAAGAGGVEARHILSLGPLPSVLQILASAVFMLALLLPYNLLAMVFARQDVIEDMKPFLGLMRSPAAPLFLLAISIGAPLSEELLFRGFLLSALSRARLGYFGATLFTTVAWTALHAGYSGSGLIEVFLAGLFFSWLLWRTGNLWVPMICHALYNSVTLAILCLVPLAW
jgi:membrane protease YdiL (CAAX protease family)